MQAMPEENKTITFQRQCVDTQHNPRLPPGAMLTTCWRRVGSEHTFVEVDPAAESDEDAPEGEA